MDLNIFLPDIDIEGYINPLSKLIRENKPKRGLEIGFCWGASAYSYLTSTKGTLLSIDIDDNKSREELFRNSFKKWDIKYGDSHNILPTLKRWYDYIYVDGSHEYKDVIQDLRDVWKLHSGIIVCDDYGTKEGVRKAVDEFSSDTEEKIEIHPLEGSSNGAIWFQ